MAVFPYFDGHPKEHSFVILLTGKSTQMPGILFVTSQLSWWAVSPTSEASMHLAKGNLHKTPQDIIFQANGRYRALLKVAGIF